LRIRRAEGKTFKKYVSLDFARRNKFKILWDEFNVDKPQFTGIKYFNDYSIEELSNYIDWTPFFTSWQLKGKYPKIFSDEYVGKEAQTLFNDAQSLLRRIIDESWLTAKGVFGIFKANSTENDSIKLFDDSGSEIQELHCLRQQTKKADGLPYYSLSDFIAPVDSNKEDYMGAFAVTTGLGIEKWVKHFEDSHDDYSAILLKSLADRLAEAFAERLHERIRKEFWAYDSNESLENQELIKEKYRGIRPAPGYPACPEHSEKVKLFEMLDVEKQLGIKLTESYAMYPAASVSGWYFAHPKSKYFGINTINDDQLENYASRKNIEHAKAKSLMPYLLE
jgi:5-methyltetrahydrofolate--homocysteine methyltransferase